MINKNVKRLIKAFALVFVLVGSHSAFATDLDMDGTIPTGVITPCQQLWLVNDPNNATELPPPDGPAVCVDVPVSFHHQVKVLFNLDSPIMSGPNPVGLRHMVMLATALQHQIAIGNLDSDDISVIGIFHGSAMAGKHWPFKDSPVAGWIAKVLSFNTAATPIHMQLEACGVTLRGMEAAGAVVTNPDGTTSPVDKTQLLPGIYVNQGAIGRIIYLQQHGYAYIQEGGIDVDQ